MSDFAQVSACSGRRPESVTGSIPVYPLGPTAPAASGLRGPTTLTLTKGRNKNKAGEVKYVRAEPRMFGFAFA
jgi:hypothetical protein